MSRNGARGTVASLHVKPLVAGERGLPKPSVASVELKPEGAAGDHNQYRTRKKDGDPAMAVLLLASEVLEALREEGWPVEPGHLGENVLARGIPYGEMTPGTRWRVGGAVLEVTAACTPCTNLRVLAYVGDARAPEFIKTLLGRRGWYARVVEPGRVRVGDAMERHHG